MPRALPRTAKSSERRLEGGRMGRQVAGADTVEIKATIEAKNLRAALKLFGLKDGDAEERIIYFFDTAKLDLFRAGVIVRARRVPGAAHDSTIKIRPVEKPRVPGTWLSRKGFKLEADAGEKGVVLSASLSRNVDKGVIKRVAAGQEKLRAVFDKDQELFLSEMCRVRVGLDKLKVLGPIGALWWKVQHPGLPYPMTAELWTRGDRAAMLEVSIRVPHEKAAFASAGFMGFLSELGARRDNARQTKTLWALEYSARTAGGDNDAAKTAKAKASKGKSGAKPKTAAKTAMKPATKRDVTSSAKPKAEKTARTSERENAETPKKRLAAKAPDVRVHESRPNARAPAPVIKPAVPDAVSPGVAKEAGSKAAPLHPKSSAPGTGTT